MNEQAVKVKKALVALGNSGKQVAAKLKSLGIRGAKHSCLYCPIAKFVKEISRSEKATVSYDRADLFGDFTDDNMVGLPRGVRRFIRNHDAGMYPFLLPKARRLKNG